MNIELLKLLNSLDSQLKEIKASVIMDTETKNLENFTEDKACISERNDDMQRSRVTIGYTEAGQPIYKRIQAQGESEMNDKIVQAYIDSGRIEEFIGGGKKEKHLFKDYAEEFFKLYKGGLKPRTAQSYQNYMHKHIIPFFGHLFIEDITTATVQSFMNQYKQYAAKSLKNYLSVLKQILSSAVEDGIIDKSPADSKRLRTPTRKATKRQALSRSDEADIVRQLEGMPTGREKLYVSLLLYTGMRRGELLGLQWSDIDFTKGMISVQRAVTHPQNQAVVSTPKTENGERSIPILPQLRVILEEMKDNKGFLFGGEKPISLRTFENMWKKIKTLINVHGATPHVFRHSFITRAVEAGVNIKALQEIAGHSDISVTMDIYSHAQHDNIKSAGVEIAQAFSQL